MNVHDCMKPVLIFVAVVALLLTGSSVRAGDLANLSTRASVGTGDDVLIGGIIVTGNTSKRVILRAISPPLGASALQDPILDLHDSSGNVLQANDDWRYGPELEIEASALASTGDYDSAIIAVLDPGNHTAIIHGYAHRQSAILGRRLV